MEREDWRDKESSDEEYVRNAVNRWHCIYGVCIFEDIVKVDCDGEFVFMLLIE